MKKLPFKSALGLIVASCILGCGSGSDGPQLSDDELLKRGKGGHDAAANNAQKPPPGTPGSPDQLGGVDPHAKK